jgi:hypothetical protein
VPRRGRRPIAGLSAARRSLAVLGMVGVLAGGYALSGSSPSAPPPVMAMVPVGMAPDLNGDGEWASRAGLALASVDQQLVDLDEAEEAWEDTPAARRDEEAPTAISELRERREELERRRTTLQAQLGTYGSLNRTRDELSATQDSLRSVEDELARAPRDPGSEERAAQVAELEDQRDQHQRRLDAARNELLALQDNVRSAVRTPLPDDDEVTAEVRAEALEAVEAAGGETGADPAPERDGIGAPDESEE